MTPNPNGCHDWNGSLDNKGYGQFSFKGKPRKAHRVAFEFFRQPPGKLFVCHKCDRPCCVNPDHLFLRTSSDNLRDMGQKKRQRLQINPALAKGQNNNQSKLRDDQVAEIKRRIRLGAPKASLAREFGVKPCTVYSIAYGRSWTHLR